MPELYGKVILDESSRKELYEEVRKDVVKEIRESGNTASEIESYLKDVDYPQYVRMLRATIDTAVEKFHQDEHCWNDNQKAGRILESIQNILRI